MTASSAGTIDSTAIVTKIESKTIAHGTATPATESPERQVTSSTKAAADHATTSIVAVNAAHCAKTDMAYTLPINSSLTRNIASGVHNAEISPASENTIGAADDATNAAPVLPPQSAARDLPVKNSVLKTPLFAPGKNHAVSTIGKNILANKPTKNSTCIQ